MGVIAMPGPVPKRSEVRRRQNKPTTPVSKAPASPMVRKPPPLATWHPIAVRWFEALGASGQAVFFEPSDWAHATFVADAMSRLCNQGRYSAQLFTAIDSASARLLVTEGDRRRLRVELQREPAADVDEDAAVAMLDDWRDRLGGA
jgi:hypothetical protein